LHDLFLSYNRADAEAVRDVRAQLEARGIRTFIDWHDLDAGQPWSEALERALTSACAVAVFIGRAGFGVWQRRELDYALDLQARSPGGSRPVVPVILRGAEPPAGFLALNTWVDLRGGIDAGAIEPLVRMLEGAAASAPSMDVSPYRALRAFREEDAALFFGREEAIGAIVAKIDRAPFVAIVGSSGSGKSSVAIAGVIPRLRKRRAPQSVWDAVVFTPGTNPWRGLADALVPLLEPELSNVEKLHKGGVLEDALQQKNGIASAVARVLAESRGTDRLLVVVDQFEELFTLTDADVARGFLRALAEASRSTPMTVLVTLRGDYYGKAIAFDRELSNGLPEAQVNLGPMRREELREVIVKPATMAGLRFEAGLADAILDDVGQEPGNLPLLEYALSELWEHRSDGELTFAAYREIGGVAGALAQRANALYDPLGAAEKSAVRRLMTRLVRVSAADEEGADTRRRARREEIDDDAWKLVDSFVKARLLVAGENDVVEVAHEALIRRWDRLRDWLNEDRRFLLWRQQLAVYRDAWPESLPPGPILDEAQKWWRERRAELSAPERAHVERSATKMMRTRRLVRMAVALGVVAVLVLIGLQLRTRTAEYNVDRILDRQPDERLFGDEDYGPEHDRDVADLALLVRLGREQQVMKSVRPFFGPSRPERFVKVALAMQDISKPRAHALLQEAANGPTADWQYAKVARAWAVLGERERAMRVLNDAELKVTRHPFLIERIAETWLLIGAPKRARRILLDPDGVIESDVVDTLIRVNDPADRERIAKAVEQMIASLGVPNAQREVTFQFIVQAFVDVGNFDEARRLLAASPTALTRDEVLKKIALAEARLHGRLPESRVFADIDDGNVENDLVDELVSRAAHADRDSDVDELVAAGADPIVAFAAHTKHLVNAGKFEKGIVQARKVRPYGHFSLYVLTRARLAYALARIRRNADAESEIQEATDSSESLTETGRDEVHSILAPALAALGRYAEARELADAIEHDEYQLQAYFGILRVYEESRPKPPR
jgi:TIR domain